MVNRSIDDIGNVDDLMITIVASAQNQSKELLLLCPTIRKENIHFISVQRTRPVSCSDALTTNKCKYHFKNQNLI